MTYSYSSPVSYGPQQNDVYYTNTMPKKHFSAGNAMTTGVVLGGLAGTVVGATKKNYLNKDGSFSDSFVKSTFENYINNSEKSSKKAYTEGLEILKKIDSVKTPEELKALFDANPEAAEEIFNELKQTPDDFLNNIRKRNLNSNKKTIKSKINAGNNTRYQLGTTRILYAMSRDHFLPKSWNAIHEKFKTPHIMTWVSGLIVIICGLFMDLNISAELCNFGTFTSFIVICIAVLILRKTEPNRERPFKVPFCPLFPILGVLTCLALMYCKFSSKATSALYFIIWLLVGILIYALYSYKEIRRSEK